MEKTFRQGTTVVFCREIAVDTRVVFVGPEGEACCISLIWMVGRQGVTHPSSHLRRMNVRLVAYIRWHTVNASRAFVSQWLPLSGAECCGFCTLRIPNAAFRGRGIVISGSVSPRRQGDHSLRYLVAVAFVSDGLLFPILCNVDVCVIAERLPGRDSPEIPWRVQRRRVIGTQHAVHVV